MEYLFIFPILEEFEHIKDGSTTLTQEEIERAKSFFTEPPYETLDDTSAQVQVDAHASENRAFSKWLSRNVRSHRVAGYASVTLSLKPTGVAPGDATDRQLEIIADLADTYSFGEARTTREQNMVLADVKKSDLFELWQQLKQAGFATPNIGSLTDIVACPGGDFCSLANAKSIPIAEAIQRQFDDLDYVYDLGELDLNISGCMNACGHHHIGHIGILGVDKKGAEFYQVQLGGSAANDARLGTVLGPSFGADEVPEVIQKIIDVYVENRTDEEQFIDTYQRLGNQPFKERVYAKAS